MNPNSRRQSSSVPVSFRGQRWSGRSLYHASDAARTLGIPVYATAIGQGGQRDSVGIEEIIRSIVHLVMEGHPRRKPFYTGVLSSCNCLLVALGATST